MVTIDDAMPYVAVPIVVIMMVFLAWVIGYAAVDANTDARCIREGWSGSAVTWKWERFCHRRIEQTDSIVTLEWLESR